MTQRCDVCTLKAKLPPKSLTDVYAYLAPPIALLEAIENWERKAPDKVDPTISAFRNKWITLLSPEPSPVDKLDKPTQATLINGGVKYE